MLQQIWTFPLASYTTSGVHVRMDRLTGSDVRKFQQWINLICSPMISVRWNRPDVKLAGFVMGHW
jgi:hypothetical protein